MTSSSPRQTKKVYDQHYSYNLIENGSIVFCTLQGYITEEFLSELMSQHKKRLDKLRAEGKPALLITDITNVTGISSKARRAISLFRHFDVDRSAVIGATPIMTLLTRYVIRLTGTSRQHHMFRTKRGAINWLKAKTTPPRIAAARIFVSIIAAAGLAMLAGWAFDIRLLQTLAYSANPVDPIASINLIVISIALTILVLRKKTLVRHLLIRACAVWLILFALVGLAYNWLDAPILGSLRLPEPTFSNNTRFLALFLLVGLLLWQATYPLKRKWPSRLFRFTMIPTVISTLVFIGANAFGVTPIYGMGVLLIFLMVEISLVLITFRKPGRFPVARFIVFHYWQGIVAFLIIFSLAIAVWHTYRTDQEQATLERASQAIKTQTTSNFAVLHEYRAFFNASELVTEEEFQYYSAESGAHQNFDIMNILFIDATPTNEYIPLYSSHPEDKALFNNLDLVSNVKVRQLLDSARDSGMLESEYISTAQGGSEAVNLTALAVYSPALEIPNTMAERATQLQGFIVADLNTQIFMQRLFNSSPVESGVALTVTDHVSGDVLYRSPYVSQTENNSHILDVQTVSVAGMSWDISILRNNFGNGAPWGGSNTILTVGGLIGVVTGVIVVWAVRRRYHIQQLVNAVGVDIQQERDHAISLAQKNDAIIASVGDGLVVTDHEERVVRTNERFTELTGWRQEDLLGRKLSSVIAIVDAQGEKVPHSRRPIYHVLHSDSQTPKTTSIKDNLRYVCRDGTEFPAGITVAPIIIEGRVTGVIETVRDITKELEIDRAKTEFVSLAAHQLRSPLTATKWYLELLMTPETGELSTKQHQYTQGAHKATNRTIQLVNALLNVSRVEVGSAAVDPQPTDLRAFVQEVIDDHLPQVSEHRLRVTEQFDQHLPKVNVDPRLMQIIVTNLLSNAIKYTPKRGSITVTLRKQPHGILLAITDTGYGISQSQQNMIFTKLFRADNIKSKSTEGTGLGLYLVKSIIDYTGCRIWFDSTENVGSTFYVQIPNKGMSKRQGTTIAVNVDE